MPAIIIKDYQWRQTEKKIIIHVPLKSRPKNVDLFAMDNYVKVLFHSVFKTKFSNLDNSEVISYFLFVANQKLKVKNFYSPA